MIATRRLETALRLGWDAHRYGQGHRDEADEDLDRGGCSVQVVDEAINSEFWWASLCVLDFIAKLLMSLWSWSESCFCHESEDLEAAPCAVRNRWLRCPLRGKRAPCLANGDFFQRLNTVAGTAAAELLQSLPATLSAQERATCLQEFERARAHLFFVFTLRFRHWQVAPWMVFGCAHHHIETAKMWVRRCLASTSQHAYMLRLRGELRAEAEAWLAGDDLEELQLLSGFLGELRFALTAERAIEGEHAKVLPNEEHLV